jgi:hypothetical protein
MERDGLGVFEVLVLVLAGAALLVVGVVWAGAALALLLSGAPQGVTFSAAADATGGLPSNLAAPAAAWPAPYAEALPGAPLYWLSTGIAGAMVAAIVGLGVRWFSRSKVGTTRRRPLGVDARPGFARHRDLRALLVKALSRSIGSVNRAGATEERSRWSGRRGRARRLPRWPESWSGRGRRSCHR